jgi:hypothetical protein
MSDGGGVAYVTATEVIWRQEVAEKTWRELMERIVNPSVSIQTAHIEAMIAADRCLPA